MAQDLERFGVTLGQDRQRDVPLDRPVEVPHRTVHLRGHRRAGEPGSDALRDRSGRRAARHLPHAAVGQRHAYGVAHSETTPGCATGGVDGAYQKYSVMPTRISTATMSQRPTSGPRDGSGRAFMRRPSTRKLLRVTRDAVNLTASRILP
jgi:hypothetical protein